MSVKDRVAGKWGGTALLDMQGRSFQVGDKVAKAMTSGRGVNLSICEVTKIEGDKLYLNDSKVAVNYPGRMLVVTEIITPK